MRASMTFEDCLREAKRAQRRYARRERERERSSGLQVRTEVFKAGDVNRLVEDWVATIMHPDDELRWSLRRIRARSREQSRNNPFAKAYLGALTVNVLGPSGPRLQCQVRNNDDKLAKPINDRIEESFMEWAQRPTIDGKLSFAGLQHLALRTVAGDGESLVRLYRGFDNPWGFAVELVDCDQLDELYNLPQSAPEVRMGVEVDQYGRPLAYHVFEEPLIASGYGRQRERIPAADMLHLYHHERANQTRGLPWTAVVMWALRMLEGYSEAEVVASRTAAAKMGFWTKKPDETMVGELAVDKATGKIAMDAAPGSFDFGPDGYELQSWDPQHPSANYSDFVKAKLREIASGLGMSYNALASDLEGVNYSSMRSGLLIEREVWRVVQRWWIDSFLRPIFGEWLNMALLTGKLKLDNRVAERFRAHRWAPRGWQWVDPLKDTNAGILGIKAGLTSRTRLLAEQGLDYETVLEELKAEAEAAREAGVDVSGPEQGGGAFGGSPADDDEDEVPAKKPAPARAAVLAALSKSRNGGGHE